MVYGESFDNSSQTFVDEDYMRRSIKEMTEERKQAEKPRDYFQRPRVPDRPEHSAGWDAQPEWSGSSWSGERWSGRNQSGGRER